MNCHIFLHSTTGNTRLVTEHTAKRMEGAGWKVTVQDIAETPSPPSSDDLKAIQLLGVACPSMYFRPSPVMERFIHRLPGAPKKTPAFLLGTGGGEPGAHFDLLAEFLAHKDIIALGASFTPFINNWPPHRAVAEKIPGAGSLARLLDHLFPGHRPKLHWFWPLIGEPTLKERSLLDTFLDEMMERATNGKLEDAPAPSKLFHAAYATKAIGRLLTPDKMRLSAALRIDADRCNRCGVCIQVCPVGCLERAHGDAVPEFGPDCTACWTCFQKCPEQAISGLISPHGSFSYPGPSKEVKRLFRG